MEHRAIRHAAQDFREAIERARPQLSTGLRAFPLGACGDTVLLRGTYLAKAGLGTFTHMHAVKGHFTWNKYDLLQQLAVLPAGSGGRSASV